MRLKHALSLLTILILVSILDSCFCTATSYKDMGNNKSVLEFLEMIAGYIFSVGFLIGSVGFCWRFFRRGLFGKVTDSEKIGNYIYETTYHGNKEWHLFDIISSIVFLIITIY